MEDETEPTRPSVSDTDLRQSALYNAMQIHTDNPHRDRYSILLDAEKIYNFLKGEAS